MFPVLTARSFSRDFFMVNLRFNPVFYLLKYCKAIDPQALFHQEIKVKCREKSYNNCAKYNLMTPPPFLSYHRYFWVLISSICGTIFQLFSDFSISGSLPLFSSNHKYPHNKNLVIVQGVSQRLARDYPRMSLLFFHSHLKTFRITKSSMNSLPQSKTLTFL